MGFQDLGENILGCKYVIKLGQRVKCSSLSASLVVCFFVGLVFLIFALVWGFFRDNKKCLKILVVYISATNTCNL